jgi:hypothetical protein
MIEMCFPISNYIQLHHIIMYICNIYLFGTQT